MGCRNSRATKTENSTVSVKDLKNKDQKVSLQRNNEFNNDRARGKTKPTEEDKKRPNDIGELLDFLLTFNHFCGP